MKVESNNIEIELKKRLKYPYKWRRKQSDDYDEKTNFIYKIFNFNELLEKIDNNFHGNNEYDNLFNYTLNRWYNFWSATAVERIFCSLPNVKPALNKYDKLVDFKINGISFDHKTSVFPRTYTKSYKYAKANPKHIIKWLYLNQSQQQRKHFKNRLFIILYNSEGPNWKLKAEISLLKKHILNYMNNFQKDSLVTLDHKDGFEILSDVIWVKK